MPFCYGKEIESGANPQVKALVRLHNRRHRRQEARMLVDGIRPCLVGLRSGICFDQLFVCPELLVADNAELDALVAESAKSGVRVTRVSRAVADKIACRENSDGVVGVAPLLERPLAGLEAPDNPLILLVEGIEKPGNLGAMLRTADGAGVDAVIICDPVTDLGNPNVVRASMGTVFSMPIGVADAASVRDWLGARGVTVIAASPEATVSYWDADVSGPTAIAVGAEHDGLSQHWRQGDQLVTLVSIPMKGQADSLNVSTAAALLIYEAVRQRR